MNLGMPWMLLLLPLVALAGWLMARARGLQREAACRLKGVAPQRGPVRLERRDVLALASMACIVVALARPQWNPQPFEVERRGRDLVIALDVSRSMLAADVFPSRLEVARIAIHEALPALAGQRIGLITFAGSASVRVPLTLDHGFVRYMLERADPSDADVGSTSLQAAVEKAAGSVLTDAAGGRRDLILFTDGEDHLSNLEQTAELLANCGARVLIVGLGDPVQGARVPTPGGADPWMRYKDRDAEVISRLDERTLTQLCGKSERVTYFPARTRPFDLVPLYETLVSGTADEVVVGELRRVRYTEGYPLLLGLAVVLWLASLPSRLPSVCHLALVVLLLPGCARPRDDGDQAAFQAKFQRGGELLQHAQEQSAADLSAARSLLLEARDAFLDAGLLRPGDIETARQITLATGRLREWDAALEQQRAAEQQRSAGLAEIIGQLEQLTLRQARLGQQSAQLLARRLVSPKADLSKSGERDNVMDDDDTTVSRPNDRRLALPAAKEQQAVSEGTAQVLDSVASQRQTLRQLLAEAYGNTEITPPTELDPIADSLADAAAAQQQALASLAPESIHWPKANTALHIAAGRMQQALDTFRSLQPPVKDQEDSTMPAKNAGDYDEDMEISDSDGQGRSQPVSAGDFQAALSLQSLPVPNYTSAEILAEEAANQQARARQKSIRAGAKVEKNW
ncbi:MAG: VWA domain-containing protein [Pirellulaceae bacterium]|nr:VWA domain-containing protein [Pirellulaceae bacterium]